MIQNASFRRKVLYLAIIALLLIPLYMIGHPAAGDPTAADSTPGGRLSQLRSEYELSQAELGEIDPASESMKLATLGMRGVAAQILWTKANEYKKTQNWEQMIASINQMAKLQPNYIGVWEFQSHNVSYNVSVEHDDFRFRYLWVKKGIDFLIQGTRYNRKEPRLFHSVGWFTGQKFGRADESKQFRRLFQDDDDFHQMVNQYVDVDAARGARGKPDNWLLARLWYNEAYNLVDTQGRSIGAKTPHIFFADGPKSRMNYAAEIEAEGILDEKAEYEWEQAAREWKTFGDRQVPTSIGPVIRLNEEEFWLEEVNRISKELDDLVPGARAAIMAEKRAKLTEAQRVALDTPLEQIQDAEQYTRRGEAIMATEILPTEVAARANESIRAQAYRLADRIAEANEKAHWTNRYRETVNFEYWRARCEVEQRPQAVSARRHIYDASQLAERLELEAARREYELAWDDWAEILKANPELMERLMVEDLVEDIQDYIQLLDQLDVKLPADFKLRPLLELHDALPAYLREAADPANAAPVAPVPPAEPTPALPNLDQPAPDAKPAATPAP